MNNHQSAPARATYSAWLSCCGTSAGGDNLIRVAGTLYAIDMSPKELKSGGLRGRVHAHRNGGFFDVGGFHIDGSGRVLRCPAELRAVMPGAEDADGDDHGAVE